MTTATATPPKTVFTTADLLAMPDDGVERWLVDGKIVEVGMTIRNKHHARAECRISFLLETWRESRPEPRGLVFAGEVGIRLRHNPELTVGIDAVYLSPELSARAMADDTTTIIDGVPTLAVEILSPSTTIENLRTKIDSYRAVGVPLVWVIDPHFHTVTVHRPGRPPVLLNEEQELDGGTELPGFQVPVARLFTT